MTPRLSREIFFLLSSPLHRLCAGCGGGDKGARTSLQRAADLGRKTGLASLSLSLSLERVRREFPGIDLRAYDGKEKRGGGGKARLRSHGRTSDRRIAPLSRASFRPNAATARRAFPLKFTRRIANPTEEQRLCSSTQRSTGGAEGKGRSRLGYPAN